jgi:hypothetical protein
MFLIFFLLQSIAARILVFFQSTAGHYTMEMRHTYYGSSWPLSSKANPKNPGFPGQNPRLFHIAEIMI